MSKDRLSKDLDELINQANENLKTYAPKLIEIIEAPYDWPELDTLRYENVKCILFGSFQSSILMSIYMVETVLKVSIKSKLFQESQNATPTDLKEAISDLKQKTEEVSLKINSLDLSKTINKAKRLNLITKAESKELLDFKIIRNSYFHSNHSKLFSDSDKIPVSFIQFGVDNPKIEETEMSLGNNILLEGFALAKGAEQNALNMFFFVDQLVRKIFKNTFPSDLLE